METSLVENDEVEGKVEEECAQDELDGYLDEIGNISRYQIWLIAAGILLMFSGFTVTTVPIFLTATPEFRCAEGSLNDLISTKNWSENTWEKISLKHEIPEYRKCNQFTLNESYGCRGQSKPQCIVHSIESTQCDNFTYDRTVYKESITTEWNLVCDRRMLKAVANSFMFFGYFVGSLASGWLGDRFGRRIALMTMALVTGVFGITTALSPNYITYVISFTMVSAGSIGEFMIGFGYVSEISNRKQRDDVLMIATALAALGDVVISPVACIFRHWRYISTFCGVVALVCVPVCYFMAESPRWLLSVGKELRAQKIVKRYFDSKGMKFDENRWTRVVKAERLKRKENGGSGNYNMFHLFKYPNIRMLSLNVMSCWFIVATVYYGLILNIGNLAGDPYVNAVINSMLDIMGSMSILVVVRFASKRRILSASFFLAGTGCISSMLLLQAEYDTVSVVSACIGRYAAACAYKISYMITAEVYPTVLRSSGLSLGSGVSRIGGMVSPFTVEAQETLPWIMQTLFGSLSFIAGLLAFAFPDTERIGLMSSVDEVEEFCSENLPHICRRKTSTHGRRFTSASLSSGFGKVTANSVETRPLSEPV